jgi:hypothetical protein
MGYKALVMLELNDKSRKKCSSFYDILAGEEWVKINNLTAAWKVFFDKDMEREEAVKTIKVDIQKAKQISGIKSVNYAVQLSRDSIEVALNND